MTQLLLWTTALLALCLLTVVLLARWALLRLRRVVVCRLRAVRRASLRAPAVARSRPALGLGRVDRLRRELRVEVAGAQRAVAAGRRSGWPVEGLASLTGQLDGIRRALDADLEVIAAEPDRARRRSRLALQAERAAALRQACWRARDGVLLAGAATGDGDVPTALADELEALALRAAAYRELMAPTR